MLEFALFLLNFVFLLIAPCSLTLLENRIISTSSATLTKASSFIGNTIVIKSVPSFGLHNVESYVTIHGSNIPFSNDLKCQFTGDIAYVSNASWLFDSLVTCPAPKLILGQYSVTLCQEFKCTSISSASYSVVSRPIVYSSEVNGEYLIVKGNHFLLSQKLDCLIYIDDSKILLSQQSALVFNQSVLLCKHFVKRHDVCLSVSNSIDCISIDSDRFLTYESQPEFNVTRTSKAVQYHYRDQGVYESPKYFSDTAFVGSEWRYCIDGSSICTSDYIFNEPIHNKIVEITDNMSLLARVKVSVLPRPFVSCVTTSIYDDMSAFVRVDGIGFRCENPEINDPLFKRFIDCSQTSITYEVSRPTRFVKERGGEILEPFKIYNETVDFKPAESQSYPLKPMELVTNSRKISLRLNVKPDEFVPPVVLEPEKLLPHEVTHNNYIPVEYSWIKPQNQSLNDFWRPTINSSHLLKIYNYKASLEEAHDLVIDKPRGMIQNYPMRQSSSMTKHQVIHHAEWISNMSCLSSSKYLDACYQMTLDSSSTQNLHSAHLKQVEIDEEKPVEVAKIGQIVVVPQPQISIIDIQNDSLRIYIDQIVGNFYCEYFPGRLFTRAFHRDFWHQCKIPSRECGHVRILGKIYATPEYIYSNEDLNANFSVPFDDGKEVDAESKNLMPTIESVDQVKHELYIHFAGKFPMYLFSCNDARLSWLSDVVGVCQIAKDAKIVKLKFQNIILRVHAVVQDGPIKQQLPVRSEMELDYAYEAVVDSRLNFFGELVDDIVKVNFEARPLMPMICRPKQPFYFAIGEDEESGALHDSKSDSATLIAKEAIVKRPPMHPHIVDHFPKQFISDKVFFQFLPIEFDDVACRFNSYYSSSLIIINETIGYCDTPDNLKLESLIVELVDYTLKLEASDNLFVTVSPDFVISSEKSIWLSITFSVPIEINNRQLCCKFINPVSSHVSDTCISLYVVEDETTRCAFSLDGLSSYPIAQVTLSDPFNSIIINSNHVVEIHHWATIYDASLTGNVVTIYALTTIVNPSIYKCKVEKDTYFPLLPLFDDIFVCSIDKPDFLIDVSICLMHNASCVTSSNSVIVNPQEKINRLIDHSAATVAVDPVKSIEFVIERMYPAIVTSDTPWLYVRFDRITDRSNLSCLCNNSQDESQLHFINATHGKCQVSQLFHYTGVFDVTVLPSKQIFQIYHSFQNAIISKIQVQNRHIVIEINSDNKVTHCRIGNRNYAEVMYLSPTSVVCNIREEFLAMNELHISFDDMHSWLNTGFNFISDTPPRMSIAVGNLSIQLVDESISGELIDILKIEPVHGPMSHSTIVKIFGAFKSEISMCRFGIGSSFVIAREIINEVDVISCVAPPSSKDVTVSVSLVSSSGSILRSKFAFTYDEDVLLLSSTFVGPNRIMLTGKNFINTGGLSCMWNSNSQNGFFVTLASYLSSEAINCNLPARIMASRAECTLTVSSNGLFYKSSSIPVRPLALVNISSIRPLNGPAFRGGTIVSINVDSFNSVELQKTTDLTCQFGQHKREATIMSSNENSSTILCESPSHFNSTLVSFSLHDTGGTTISGNDSIKFWYVLDHSVRNLVPSSSSVSGNIPVIVIGSNFLNTSSLGCIFGDISVRATFINPSVLTCIAPSRVGAPDASVVSVEVTNNGLDYSQSGIKFRYVTRSSSSSSGVYSYYLYSLTCPNGTYCQTPENSLATNFSLCSPGFFQPRAGQSACLPCPVGYYCPDSGLSRPIACPAGLVCDVTALITPIKSCPRGSYCLVGTKTFYLEDFVPVSDITSNRTGVLASASTSSIAYGDWIYQEQSGVVVFNISSSNHNWGFQIRSPNPEIGVHRYEHPPDVRSCGLTFEAPSGTASRRCRNGVTDLTAEQPYPCPLGHYCRTGVSTDVPTPKNFSTPQRCFDGFFCPRGATNPEGSGPCPTGYYCPSQTEALRCPRGYYCPGVGNTAPLQCYPGTFNPDLSQSNCTACPSGHICPGWGRQLPEICPAGFVCIGLGLSMPVLLCPQGYYCGEGVRTLDPADETEYRPIPCAAQVFCLGGVAHNSTIDWLPFQPEGQTALQTCTEGTYCGVASAVASGSGTCFQGHYCPPGVDFPIPTPIGNFASQRGSVAPTMCFPGTYSPLIGMVNCRMCPAGYTCQGYGTYQPEICSNGTYRSTADSVTCRLCPTGTYQPDKGATDISHCLPCPQGRVCGTQGMMSLKLSKECPAGHACGYGTDRSNQFDHKCPAGHNCPVETTPFEQLDRMCIGGYYCNRGTPDYLALRNKCSLGYYCPPGTASGSQLDTKCPRQTTSLPGVSHIYSCQIADVDVCDKKANEDVTPDLDNSYYPELQNVLLDDYTTVIFDSLAEQDATGEVLVVEKVYTLNESSSDFGKLWQNDTIEVFRTCLPYVRERGARLAQKVVEEKMQVIGRNFIDSGSTYCRFTACDQSDMGLRMCKNADGTLGRLSKQKLVIEADYLSSSRLRCTETPSYIFDEFQTLNSSDCTFHNGTVAYVGECSLNDDECLEANKKLVIPCSVTEACPNNPQRMMKYNPCVTGQIFVEASNDGWIWSGDGLLVSAISMFTRAEAEADPNIKRYTDFLDYSVPPSYAILTVISSQAEFDSSVNSIIRENDYNFCNRSKTSQEDSNSPYFSPISTTTNGKRPRESGWFMLEALDSAHISIDLSHVPSDNYSNFIYDQHWKVAVYVRPSRCDDEVCNSNRVRLPPAERVPCRLPIKLPRGLTDPSVPKNQVLNLTVTALDDAIVRVELHIVHGLYLPMVPYLKNSTSVKVSRPARARATDGIIGGSRKLSPYVSLAEKRAKKSYFFGIVYKREASETIATPLNLPPKYADYERGRVLASFNSTHESVNTPAILDPYAEVNRENDFWDSPAPIPQEGKELQDVYFETFHEMTVEGSEFVYDFQNLLIPYFPFFSNCRGVDSYLFTAEALESHSECYLPPSIENGGLLPSDWVRYEFPALPHIDDIDFVGPFELGMSPIADWCERDIVCSYEEFLSEATVVPRWFEAGTGDVLYYIIREPIDYQEYVGRRHGSSISLKDSGGGATVTQMLQLFGPDIFIQVTVNRDAAELISGGCDVMCYPRAMSLDISYYQLDERTKRIIYADLIYETFDKLPNNTEYDLHISYYPLSYLELVIAFAYSREVFLSLFVLIGLLAIFISSALWLVMRLTTQIDNPPSFKFWGFITLLAPSAAAGVMLGMIPIGLTTMLVAILVRGDTLLIDPNMEPGTWILDGYNLHYMDVRVDPENYVRARAGRLGLGFVAMSFYSILASARIFVPRRHGGREKEIEQSRDKRASKLEIWDSVLWKRSNLIFTSYMMSLFCLVIVEFSFWDEFGTYIWYIIIGLKVVDQFVGAKVQNQLSETLLANPVNTAEGIAQGYAMLSADDFMDFLLGFFVDLGISMTERCYIDPGLDGFLDWISDTVLSIKEFIVGLLPPWLVVPLGLTEFRANMEKKKAKAKAKAKAQKGSLRGSSSSLSQNKTSNHDSINKASKTSLTQRGSKTGATSNEEEEEEGDTVEPILDTLGSYSCDAMLTFYNPFAIYLLMIFREESGMPQLYNIKEQDMEYYLWFALIVIPFQFMADAFVNGALELFHGWKIFDYLVYTRYRFLQRETRWKGMEDSLDECIDESLRTLDQMCFSSQYYLAMTIHVNGIVYFFLGVEMMIRSEYNFFGDPAMLVLVPYTIICCVLIEKLCIWLSVKLSLWRIKHENTAWHAQLGQADDTTDVPGWMDVAGGLASHESFLINQRITSETFRFKFLNYNRSWVISKLPEMLTPRTLRRSRPYLTNQLQRIITAQNEAAQAKLDEEEETGKPISFGPVALNASSRNILRKWVLLAKVRLRLTSLVQPIISRSRGNECESCLSRKQLHVEYEISMDKMIEDFEAQVSKETELDETAWKAFWLRRQTHHTHCLDCITLKKKKEEADLIAGRGSMEVQVESKQDYPDWGPVFLSAPSKTILMSWYKRALTSLAARKGIWKKKVEERNRRLGIVEGDEEKDGIDQARLRLSAEVSASSVHMSAPSKAIAVRWVRYARARLQKASGFETRK